jgi:Na+/H+-translocating membrane pyrophosphatase
MKNDLPKDAVEMVREIRNRNYEATKHMTREEKRDYMQKKVDSMKKRMKEVNLDDYDFSWLRRK